MNVTTVAFALSSSLAFVSAGVGQSSTAGHRASPCDARPADAAPLVYVTTPISVNDSSAVTHVCLFRGGGSPMASYHFELYYDTSRAFAVSTTKPASGLRADNIGLPGIVSFAGASLEGFSDGVVETIEFKVRHGTLPRLALRVVEANSLDRATMFLGVKVEGPQLSLSEAQEIESSTGRKQPLRRSRADKLSPFTMNQE